MPVSEKVRKLRLLVSEIESPRPQEVYSCTTLPQGVPKGSMVELLGPHWTSWVVEFLKEHPRELVFWIEQIQSINPQHLEQIGAGIDRIQFAVVGAKPIIDLRRIVQSQLYPIVIAPIAPFTELRFFKAFQLLTEKSNSTLFLTGAKEPSTAWPIKMQLDIKKRAANFEIDLIKYKPGLSQ